MYTKISYSLLSFWYIVPVYRMTDSKSTYWHIFSIPSVMIVIMNVIFVLFLLRDLSEMTK